MGTIKLDGSTTQQTARVLDSQQRRYAFELAFSNMKTQELRLGGTLIAEHMY